MSRGGEQRGEQSHFQLARETTRARRLQGPAFFPPLVSITAGGLWRAGGAKRERRDPVATSVCRGHSVSPPLPLSSQAETEGRETRDSHFKRQFDVRSTQERSLKEDLRRRLKKKKKENIRDTLSQTPDSEVWQPYSRRGGGTRA